MDAYGGIYTSKDLAEIVGNGINRVLPQLLENEATRSLVLANLRELTGTEVKLRDGQNLWDITNSQGKSLRMILQDNIRISSDLSDQRYAGELTLQAFQDLEAGNLNEGLARLRSAGANLTDPKNLQMIVQSMNQVRSAATEIQQGNQLAYLAQLNEGQDPRGVG